MSSDQPTLFDAAARYPRRAGYKEATTSKDAADRIERPGRAASLRAAVLGAFELGWTGTADELAHRLGESVLSIRPRVTELHRQGLLSPTTERRKNASGASAHVWKLNDHRRAG
jgi:hypothetical protein